MAHRLTSRIPASSSPNFRPPAAIGTQVGVSQAPTRDLSQVEIRNRVAPQHLAPLWAVEQDEGGEQRHFGAGAVSLKIFFVWLRGNSRLSHEFH